jgi:hypothetical protein
MISISSDQAQFDEFTAERERGLRNEGEFDMADMYRELRARLLVGVAGPHGPSDVEIFDRGRTTALLKLIDNFPSDLTFYTEAGESLTANEARKLGGWLPKREVADG